MAGVIIEFSVGKLTVHDVMCLYVVAGVVIEFSVGKLTVHDVMSL